MIMIGDKMTALFVQKILIAFGLMLSIPTLPPGLMTENYNTVEAFNIRPPYRLKSSVNTRKLNCIASESNLSQSISYTDFSSKTKLYERSQKAKMVTNHYINSTHQDQDLKQPNDKIFSSTISIPILAKAALATYDPEHTLENENFGLCNYLDFDGFRAATFCAPQEKLAIIAFRGTQNRKDAAFDLALLYGQEEVMSSFAKFFSGFGLVQDGVLETMTSFGNRVVSIANSEFSSKVEEAHKSLLEDLTKRWQAYRSQHLSPHGVAEKKLNERVGYVTNYTLKQIKHFKNLGYDVYLTGHSLGGLYAQLASMMFGLPGATFNAPGVSDVLYHCKNFVPQIKGEVNFLNYRHNDDIVSLFKLDHHFGSVIVHEFPKKDPYTAHNMEMLFKLLSDAHFDEKGDNDYKDLVAFIEDEKDTLSNSL